MNLILLYGPPAVGKLTTAKELASQIGYKIFHNHHTQDMVYPIFGFKSPVVDKLLKDIRITVFEQAMKNGKDLIFTFCFENPQHIDFITSVREKAAELGANAFFVRLFCDLDEQSRRVEDPSRKKFPAKCQTVEVLKWALQDKNIDSRIDFIGDHLELDTTSLSASQVAENIRLHYGLTYCPTDIEFKYT
ncbi:MAG: AAA family ATPase [Patescibacteria group bacterium]